MNRNLKLFLIVLLSWSGLSLGDITIITRSADVTGLIQVTKSGLVYNRNTKTFDTNLTLTNTSQVKIYGPVQLSAVTSNPNSVSLANSTGISAAGRPTLVVTPSGGVLNPGGIIKNIVLKFNDPSQVKFTYEARFDGVIEVSSIDQLIPSQASSAAKITVVGTGFRPASRVMLGTQSVTPQYVSNTQLTFVVPFSLDQNSALVPLQVGQYTIQVDGSNTVNLNVVDLPVNPNPPGQLLTDQITSIFQSLSVNIPAFQANLPQLLSDQQNNPSAQKFIQDLANLANRVNTTSVQTELTKLTNQIDPQSMDTLERSLLLNQKSNSNGLLANSVIKQNSLQSNQLIQVQQTSNTPCYLLEDGNAWLNCRNNLTTSVNGVDYPTLQTVQVLKKLSDYTSYCAQAAIVSAIFTGGVSIPLVAATCKLVSTLSSFSSTLGTVNVADNVGTLRGFTLNIAGIDAIDTQTIDLDELMISLHLNNYDNNENISLQTPAKKYINGATLKISTTQDWTNIATSLISNITSLRGFSPTGNSELDGMVTDAIKLSSDVVNRNANPPNKNLQITNANISSISDGLGGGACNHFYDINSNSLTMQQNNFQWLVLDIGPNLYPVQFRQTISGCKFSIKDPFPTEKNIDSFVQFNVKRYPKITLNVTGEGNVTYSISPVATPASEHTTCTKAKPCVEYFDASTPQLILTANNSDGTPATSTTWSGKGAENCIGATATCKVTLDSTNTVPPNITAKLLPYPPLSEVIGSWAAYTSWYAGSSPNPHAVPGPFILTAYPNYPQYTYYDIQTFRADMFWDRELNYMSVVGPNSEHWGDFDRLYKYNQRTGTIDNLTPYTSLIYQLYWDTDHWNLCSSLYTICSIKVK